MGKHLLLYETDAMFREKETPGEEIWSTNLHMGRNTITGGIVDNQNDTLTLTYSLDDVESTQISATVPKEIGNGYILIRFVESEEERIAETSLCFVGNIVQVTIADGGETIPLYEIKDENNLVIGWAYQNGFYEDAPLFDAFFTGTTSAAYYDNSSSVHLYELNMDYDSIYLENTVNSVKPGVSYTLEDKKVCYNPIVKYLTATYLVDTTGSTIGLFNPNGYVHFNGGGIIKSSNPNILGDVSPINEPTKPNWRVIYMEIDNVVSEVVSAYTFDTPGLHTVKFGIALNGKEVPAGFFSRPVGGGFVPGPYTFGEGVALGAGETETSYPIPLVKVDIPSAFTSIGDYCFRDTPLTSGVTFTPTMKKIGSCAFAGTYIQIPFDFPATIKTIGDGCFQGATLDEIPVFYGLDRIPDNCFSSANFTKEPTIPSNVRIIGEGALCHCTVPTSAITIPSNVEILETSALTTYWYGGNRFTAITINEGLKKIGDYAFAGYAGTNLTLPDSVEEIGEAVFQNTDELVTFRSGSGLKKIGDSCFNSIDNLTDVYLNDGLEEIGSNAFHSCRALTGCTIPQSVKRIGGNAFRATKIIGNINLPNLEYLGARAFEDSEITNFSGGSKLERIGADAFCDTKLTNVSIPGTNDIGTGAFSSCGALTSITLSSNLTVLGSYTEDDKNYLNTGNNGGYPFSNCSGLTSVTLPTGVTDIPYACFCGCTALSTINLGNNVKSIGFKAFYGTPWINSAPTYGNIIYPIETVAYKAKTTGSTSYTFKDTTETIMEECCYQCKNATTITIPDGVKIIGARAFTDCTALKSAVIPDSVTEVGASLFYGCSGLTSVTIGNGITSLSSLMFYEAGLRNLVIPNTITSLDNRCLGGTSLTSVTIPDSVVAVDDPFWGCSKLQYFYGNHTGITSDNKAFIINNKLIGVAYYGMTEYTIPNGVTGASDACFYYAKITGITMPESFVKFSGYTFYSASSLTRMTFLNPNGCSYDNYYGNRECYNVPSNGIMYVPTGSYDKYSNWIANTSNAPLKGKNWTIQEVSN